MALTPFTLLLLAALVLTIVGLAVQKYFVPCIGVAVLLVILAFLVGRV